MDGRRPPLSPPPSWPGLDRLGLTQAIGGLALGLIALFSSYDHITFAGRNIPIPQQWGITLIAASLATVFTGFVQFGAPLGRYAELASLSRLRAADERKSDRDRAEQRENEADRERNLAGKERQRADRERNLAGEERQRANRERNRADEARDRAAEAAERQGQATARQDRCALLSARVLLDPSDSNRARLQAFLSLIAGERPPEQGGVG